MTRRRASTLIQSVAATLPEKPQEPREQPRMHPRGIRADQEQWVKDTGRWNR